MAISSFHTHIIGADRAVGQCLSSILAEQNLLYKCVSLESRERPLLQSSARPVYVLTPSIYHPSDLSDTDFWLERAKEEDAIVVLLSSLAVCATGPNEIVNESWDKYGNDELSQGYMRIEEKARENTQHVIIRVGQLFSIQAEDFSAQILNKIRSGADVVLDMQRQFEPTPVDDVAEVMLAILRQVNYSDNLWGTYHFSGVEAVSSYAFAEALLSEAGQYEDLAAASLSTQEGTLMPTIWTPIAEHKHLFYTFGIKPKPWRRGLARLVRRYYYADERLLNKV